MNIQEDLIPAEEAKHFFKLLFLIKPICIFDW